MRGRFARSRNRSSGRSFRIRDGSSTTPPRSGRRSRACCTKCSQEPGSPPRDVAAIGITNQRETTLVWDRATGRPIAHAIVWQDRRTAPQCDALRAAGHAELIARKTGLVLDAYFSGTKIAWLLDNVDGARERAMRGELAFGTIDTWLVWNLTHGEAHVTDPSNASRTLLFDIRTRRLGRRAPRAVRHPALDAPAHRALVRSLRERGRSAASRIPIAGIAGDQQAALFGQACHAPGLAKNTYGTGCFLLMNTGSSAVASSNNLITTVAWQRDGKLDYALEGSVFIGGAVVQWLRDGLKIVRSAGEIEALAASVPDNGGVYLVPAFAGLGAPHWDAYARGAMFGLTRGTTSAHIARAALESIAFQSAEVLEAMQKDAGITLTELRVDGGATANNLLMQFQADLLGVPVVRPKVLETTALGAGYLAGLAVGYWKDAADVAANWQQDRVFEPAMPRDRVAELAAGWQKAVARAKGLGEAGGELDDSAQKRAYAPNCVHMHVVDSPPRRCRLHRSLRPPAPAGVCAARRAR